MVVGGGEEGGRGNRWGRARRSNGPQPLGNCQELISIEYYLLCTCKLLCSELVVKAVSMAWLVVKSYLGAFRTPDRDKLKQVRATS